MFGDFEFGFAPFGDYEDEGVEDLGGQMSLEDEETLFQGAAVPVSGSLSTRLRPPVGRPLFEDDGY
jgi:hypothetical protein